MSEPRTVGEAVDRYGPCNLMALVVDLAEKRGRIPVRFWVVALPGGRFVLSVNGTASEVDGIKPWECRVDYDGLPVASFNAAEGCALGDFEARITAVMKEAIGQQAGDQS